MEFCERPTTIILPRTHLYLSNTIAPPALHSWTVAKFPQGTHFVWGMTEEPAHLLGPLANVQTLRGINLHRFAKPFRSRVFPGPLPTGSGCRGQRLTLAVQATPFRHKEEVGVMPDCAEFTSFRWNH